MSADDPLLDDGVIALVSELTARGQTVATAESLTAGLLAATIAGVTGASAVLRGGLITYAVDTKITLADVPADLLAEVGPVAAATACALADGARRRCGADWGVGLTGVAGPDPHGGYPAGTVFLGIAGPHGTNAERLALAGTRFQIRRGAVDTAIERLRALVTDM